MGMKGMLGQNPVQTGTNILGMGMEMAFKKQAMDLEMKQKQMDMQFEQKKFNLLNSLQTQQMKLQQDKLKWEQDLLKEQQTKEEGEKEERKGVAYGGRRSPQIDPLQAMARKLFVQKGDASALQLMKPEKSKGPFVLGKDAALVDDLGNVLATNTNRDSFVGALNKIKSETPDLPSYAQNALAYLESRGITPTAATINEIFALKDKSKGVLTADQYADLTVAIYGQMVNVAQTRSKEMNVFGRQRYPIQLPSIEQATELADKVVGSLGKNAGMISLSTLLGMANEQINGQLADTQTQMEFNSLSLEDQRTVKDYEEQLKISREEAISILKEQKAKHRPLGTQGSGFPGKSGSANPFY